MRTLPAIALAALLIVPSPVSAQTPGSFVANTSLSATALNFALGAKADAVSPAFTGSMTAVSGMAGDQFNLAKNYNLPLTGTPHQQVSLGTLTVPATVQVWNNFDDFVYNVPGGDATVPQGALITRYIQFQRRTAAPSIPSWPLIVSSLDFTNQPSSVSGPAIGMELDLEVSGVDDQTAFGVNGSRSMLTLFALRGRTYTGTDSQIAQAISIFSDPSKLTFKVPIRISTGWTVAAFDTTGGVATGAAPTIRMAPGQSIDFTGTLRTLKWDSGQFSGSGGFRFSDNVQVDGQLYVPTDLVVGGQATFAGNTAIATGAGDTISLFGATGVATDTGWTAMTGSTDKATAYATSTVTLPQLAGRVMALQARLTALGVLRP